MTYTTQQLKDSFISFFKAKGHIQMSSSKVIPDNDPTLLFTNSGMVQFKNILTGMQTEIKRVCTVQRCIRAGGKHNDLDDVGKDTYHHTFFEMMGNWSFGDYFKKEAIQYAWEFLTDVLKLDPSRLYVTYYEDLDKESPIIWEKYCNPSHILPENKKNNFWEMGEYGPCGPCTEIHYDRIGNRDASHLVNKDDPDVIEIWNIVFIEFNNTPKGLAPLETKCIDTGIGLERLLSILNNVKSNYLIDSFTNIINNIYKFSAYKYEDSHNLIDCAFRVVSDHVRTLGICLMDGVEFSNEGQGYVMRRILRRAVRYGHDILKMQKGNLSSLVISYLEIEIFNKFEKYDKSKISEEKKDVTMNALSLDSESSKPEKNLVDLKFDSDTSISNINKLEENKEILSFLKKNNFIEFSNLDKFKLNVIHKINKEEDLFLNTLRKGVDRFNKISLSNSTISSEEIFKLYDTYGFPTDLVKLMAEEKNIKLDFSKFEEIKNKAKEMSKSKKNEIFIEGIVPTDDSMKYDHNGITSTLLAYINNDNVIYLDKSVNGESSNFKKDNTSEKIIDNEVSNLEKKVDTIDNNNLKFSEHCKKSNQNTEDSSILNYLDKKSPFVFEIDTNDQIGLIFNKTCFYSESGGQVGDTGSITFYFDNLEVGKFKVNDTKKNGNYVIHYGNLIGKLSSIGVLEYDDRLNIQRNHTGCHLFNYFVRKQIKTKQKGSLVNSSKFRFDYICDENVDLKKIENEINELIFLNKKVVVKEISKNEFLKNSNLNDGDLKLEINSFEKIKLKDNNINETEINKTNNLINNSNENKQNTVENVIKLNDIDEYLDKIRLICVEDTDIIELCGGTHVSNTGDLYKLRILSDTGISKGTRRVTGITGDEVKRIETKLTKLKNKLKEGHLIGIDNDIPLFEKQELTKLNNENKELIKKEKNNNMIKNRKNIEWIIKVNQEMDYKNLKYQYKNIQVETLKELWKNITQLAKKCEICSEFVLFFIVDGYVHGFIKATQDVKKQIGEGTFITNGELIQFSFKNKYEDAMNNFKFIKYE